MTDQEVKKLVKYGLSSISKGDSDDELARIIQLDYPGLSKERIFKAIDEIKREFP